MNNYHEVKDIKFTGDVLEANIDGVLKRFNLKDLSPVLEKATEIERNTFEISPSGYGIHWSLLDEDISIDGMLGIVNTPKKQRKIA
ncbi:MAG: DUF2442 domain-containing protein [Nitrospinae bacterium]|nr:DUF2442 domain-containing protein [Nitrospinota bacterium]